MDYIKEYERWLELADEETVKALKEMTEEEIHESFYKNMEFGTGGIRGVIGPGINRMNKYIIRKVTKGLANLILKSGEDKRVVISYDSRNFSREFAFEAADVLTGLGITTHIFNQLAPTPELSFAVRYFNATAGIMITASHNPAKYNGYKVYWSDGGQIPPTVADSIYEEMQKVDVFDELDAPNSEYLKIVDDDAEEAYIDAVSKQSLVAGEKIPDDFKVVYTPLHGSGNIPVRKILKKIGVKNVIIVPEQELPDGNFPTVRVPNPEEKQCFDLAIELAKENNVDFIFATDPDSDRLGIVVKNNAGEYVTMTGNQVGIMLLDYILRVKKEKNELPKNAAAVTTIVSTKMADNVCDHYGVKLFRTLTGFKFIGEKIYEFETSGDHTFMFGFEESYGYLSGTYCRDKDAVVAAMLVCEMGLYYQKQGLTLFEVMENLYSQYGYFKEDLVSLTKEGPSGEQAIKDIMKTYRDEGMKVDGVKCIEFIDYSKETGKGLPLSDVLQFNFDNGVSFIVRPSGTEPKIKYYILAEGANREEVEKSIAAIKTGILM